MIRAHPRSVVSIVVVVLAVACGGAGDDGPPDDGAAPDTRAVDALPDAPADAAPDAASACAACGPGTVCVQLLSDACATSVIHCLPIAADCMQPSCTSACNRDYCMTLGGTCLASSCPDETVAAFQCYR